MDLNFIFYVTCNKHFYFYKFMFMEFNKYPYQTERRLNTFENIREENETLDVYNETTKYNNWHRR